MYELMVLDLDDTTLSHDHTISKRNYDAIQKARETGVAIAICSGRATPSMWPYVEQLNLLGEHEYSLPYNGAVIVRNNDCVPIYKRGMEEQHWRYLLDYADNWNVDVQMYKDDELYVNKVTPAVERYIALHGLPVNEVGDLKTEFKGDSIKVLYNGGYQDILRINQDLKGWTENKIHMFTSRSPNLPYTEPDLLEFTHLEVNKGIAALQLAKMLGIERDEIMAMGDGFNDIFIITAVGKGVTVANAHPDIIKAADYVTEATNNEDAVAEAIEKFILV